ncbi:MAG TPA: anti-sigma factor [Bryobacteraceae bacterium]|jgi:anti-sigma factor RsiW
MNCSEILKLAPLYLSGELGQKQTRAFSAHLQACAACQRELRQQAEFDELLRTGVLAERVDSSSVDRRIRTNIEAARLSSRRRIFAAAGIAAALLAGLVGYMGFISTRTKPVYAAAARDHRMEIVDKQPRKWLTDYASIRQLAAGAGLSGPPAADFVPVGYRLAQGRLCFLNGHIFLHLVYANDTGNFSLFLRRADGAPSGVSAWGIHTGTFAAEHVAGFQRGPLTALVVTEQPGDSARRLARIAETVL